METLKQFWPEKMDVETMSKGLTSINLKMKDLKAFWCKSIDFLIILIEKGRFSVLLKKFEMLQSRTFLYFKLNFLSDYYLHVFAKFILKCALREILKINNF